MKGEPLELWSSGFRKVEASHGQNFLEIDAHDRDVDGITQDVPTVEGKKYRISFDVRARGNNLKSVSDSFERKSVSANLLIVTFKQDDEAVVLEIDNKKIEHHGYHAANLNEWTTHSHEFTATKSSTKITFRETTNEKGDDSTG